jgi:hypothetical protein
MIRFSTTMALLLFGGTALLLVPNRTRAQNQLPAQSLDGLWLTDGYGMLLEIQGVNLRTFEITKLSCIESMKATRKTGVGSADEIVFAGDDDIYRIFPGISQDTRWLHEDGAISNILLRRAGSRPEQCCQPLAITPLMIYQVFWQTFAEHYAFFGLHQVDWFAVDQQFRPQVTSQTTPQELFGILNNMIAPLYDAHTYIYAPSIDKRFRGRRPGTDSLQQGDKPRITQIIKTNYVRGTLRDFCNGQLQYGLLRSPRGARLPGAENNVQAEAIGYLRIHSFSRYSTDNDFEKGLDTLETALDDIFKDSFKLTGLVIDIRINSGGFDAFGISIASRLAAQNYIAYEKAARNDIRDPDHLTPSQPVIAHISHRPSFRGSVILLTSPHSFSAAETFTMALLGRHPYVIRVGANTQGVFSDVLDRTLPNGWTFGISNEIYRTKEGKTFEGFGVPPNIVVQIFPTEDLINGRDSALDKALELLANITK